MCDIIGPCEKSLEEITSLVPGVSKFGRFGPWRFKSGNYILGPWVIVTWHDWSLGISLESSQDQPFHFHEITRNGPCLNSKPNRIPLYLLNPKIKPKTNPTRPLTSGPFP